MPKDEKVHIYTANNLRIRPEQHPLKPGATYHDRHHGQHYHVETRKDPQDVWEKPNINLIKPPCYIPGLGTGFLPVEPFPGII